MFTSSCNYIRRTTAPLKLLFVSKVISFQCITDLRQHQIWKIMRQWRHVCKDSADKHKHTRHVKPKHPTNWHLFQVTIVSAVIPLFIVLNNIRNFSSCKFILSPLIKKFVKSGLLIDMLGLQCEVQKLSTKTHHRHPRQVKHFFLLNSVSFGLINICLMNHWTRGLVQWTVIKFKITKFSLLLCENK